MNLKTYIQMFKRLAKYRQERNDIESYKHHMIRTATDKESLVALIEQYGTYNINLMIKEDIPKNSAIPPHTPNKALSVDDFVSFCIKSPKLKLC